MEEGWTRVVALVGAKLLGMATGLPLADFLDAGLKLFGSSGPTTLRQTARKVEETLGREVGDADGAWLKATVGPLLERHAPTLQRAVELELDGLRIADEIMADGAALVRPGEHHRVRHLLVSIYEVYLADPAIRDHYGLHKDRADLRGTREILERLDARPQRVANAVVESSQRLGQGTSLPLSGKRTSDLEMYRQRAPSRSLA